MLLRCQGKIAFRNLGVVRVRCWHHLVALTGSNTWLQGRSRHRESLNLSDLNLASARESLNSLVKNVHVNWKESMTDNLCVGRYGMLTQVDRLSCLLVMSCSPSLQSYLLCSTISYLRLLTWGLRCIAETDHSTHWVCTIINQPFALIPFPILPHSHLLPRSFYL